MRLLSFFVLCEHRLGRSCRRRWTLEEVLRPRRAGAPRRRGPRSARGRRRGAPMGASPPAPLPTRPSRSAPPVPSGGERTIFDANSQQQATVELPVPIFGQARRGAWRGRRPAGGPRGVAGAPHRDRGPSALPALSSSVSWRRKASLAARRRALIDVERIRGVVAGRQGSGNGEPLRRGAPPMPRRALANLNVQKAVNEVNEHSAALAALVDSPGWAARRRRARSSSCNRRSASRAMTSPATSPLRVARDETAAAQAPRRGSRGRERYPVPAVQLSRTWTLRAVRRRQFHRRG